MKKILFIFFIISCFGCKKTNVSKQDSQIIISSYRVRWDVYEWNHKGHTYLIINNSSSANNTSITHAGHCKCSSKTK